MTLGNYFVGNNYIKGETAEICSLILHRLRLVRTNRINEIVGSKYLPRRDEVLNF